MNMPFNVEARLTVYHIWEAVLISPNWLKVYSISMISKHNSNFMLVIALVLLP